MIHRLKMWWRLHLGRRAETRKMEKQRELEEANRRLRRLERFVAVKKAGR
jgi:hypothetical protein